MTVDSRTRTVRLEPRHYEWLERKKVNLSAVCRFLIDEELARETVEWPKDFTTYQCALCHHEFMNYTETCPGCECRGFVHPTINYKAKKR
jgi:hypothetical protein